MFSMELDFSRELKHISGTNNSGNQYSGAAQILTPSSSKLWGYGAMEWSNGELKRVCDNMRLYINSLE